MPEITALRIHIQGIVQGVGFRPFVYNLAEEAQLTGWVINTSAGVEIEVEGPDSVLQKFVSALRDQAPPLAQIDSFTTQTIAVNSYQDFEIRHSQAVPGGFQPISPDVSICDLCLEELFNPQDRRYRYPFINCTNCGPRFTIIQDIPYDRPLTTMSDFELCRPCAEEYQDPKDRRFHAQPVACPNCGPGIWLEERQDSPEEPFKKTAEGDQALLEVQHLLQEGKIVAVKGLGGFHLACDAENPAAVAELRKRKRRPHKPLAVMMPDLETVEKFCQLSESERSLLQSPKRPILLLDMKEGLQPPRSVAPGQNRLGVMLPYTPLHYLLFSEEKQYPEAAYRMLVMTSGNLSDQPILKDNQELKQELNQVVDAVLLHDRDIQIPCDDSVFCIPAAENQGLDHQYPVRRSRGYAPYPVQLPWNMNSILAVGAEQKNTFCITKDRYAFMSQHIGDLKNFPTLQVFEESIIHFQNLFRTPPAALAYDLHPDYLATRYALERSQQEQLPAFPVQHHHAHITSCMADNRWEEDQPVIGIALDGTGYGPDGTIWGGEILLADYREFERRFHLLPVPLPGGDLAVREPWRMALSYLNELDLAWESMLPPLKHALSARKNELGVRPLDVLRRQLASGVNTPKTSSAGRLFDAVSSLAGIRQVTSYEGQAAIELEAVLDPTETGHYNFDIMSSGQIHPGQVFHDLIQDLFQGIPVPTAAARFHNGLAAMILEVCQILEKQSGVSAVALSGGVWQNQYLLKKTHTLLSSQGYQVLIHRRVPANDGGIALGQAAVAHHLLLE